MAKHSSQTFKRMNGPLKRPSSLPMVNAWHKFIPLAQQATVAMRTNVMSNATKFHECLADTNEPPTSDEEVKHFDQIVDKLNEALGKIVTSLNHVNDIITDSTKPNNGLERVVGNLNTELLLIRNDLLQIKANTSPFYLSAVSTGRPSEYFADTYLLALKLDESLDEVTVGFEREYIPALVQYYLAESAVDSDAFSCEELSN